MMARTSWQIERFSFILHRSQGSLPNLFYAFQYTSCKVPDYALIGEIVLYSNGDLPIISSICTCLLSCVRNAA